MSEDSAEAWGRIRGRLRQSVDASTFDLWFSELAPVSVRGSTLYMSGPPHKVTWVERRYVEVIDYALRSSGTSIGELRFVTQGSEALNAAAEETGSRPDRDRCLNPGYSFERFVIGAGNRVAHGAALAVAEAPGQAYNPLFLHGPPGLGKTHLLGAIANYLSVHSPDLVVRYTTAEWFTNEFVFALGHRGADGFKRRYRHVDVLLIDDVQFLEGKERTADEFFHTFNALHEAGAQLVLSADRLPRQLSALAERLRTRFEWGLTVEVQAPDLPTRRAFLGRLAEGRSQSLEPNLIEAIASRASDLRLLEGAYTRVEALSSLTGSPIDLELVERALPAGAPARPSAATATQIRDAVAERLALRPEQLVSNSRAAAVAQARHLAMHLTRELTDLSLPAIAASFGRRDHTTVIHALRQVERRLEADPSLRQLREELCAELSPKAIDRDRTD